MVLFVCLFVLETYAPRRMDSFSQNKPRKISLKNKRLLDDYLFTSICFWEHWFPLENKLRFLNFPVGAWYKNWGLFFRFLFFIVNPLGGGSRLY